MNDRHGKSRVDTMRTSYVRVNKIHDTSRSEVNSRLWSRKAGDPCYEKRPSLFTILLQFIQVTFGVKYRK